MVSLPLSLGFFYQFFWRLLAVTLWVVLCPPPKVLARLLKRLLRFPIELRIRSRGVRSQVKHVSGSTCDDFVRQVAANSMAEGSDHIENSGAFAGAEVPSSHTRVVVTKMVERDQVPAGEVVDMDIVADRSTVLGLVVCNTVSVYYSWTARVYLPSPKTRIFSRLPTAT